MLLPQIHVHPNPLETIAPKLLPYLPNSLPLLRRLQFHHSSPSARTLATFPPTTPTSSSSPPPSPSFSATYVDRSRAPETECWIFTTYETTRSQNETPHSDHDQDQPRDRDAAAQTKAQLLALLHTISQLPSSNNRPLMVVGTFPNILLPLLGGHNLTPQKVVTRNLQDNQNDATKDRVLNGISVPYMKWRIAPPPPANTTDNEPHALPPTYTFSHVHPSELALIISRTDIPKTEETLAKLGNVGIRYIPPLPPSTTSNQDQDPKTIPQLISWTFLSSDGSLSTLHVEPAHRNQGLAKAVARKVLAKLAEDPLSLGFRNVVADNDDDPSRGWAVSDVAVENVESAGVAKGLGGREGWLVRWVSVDLRRVERVVGDLLGGGDIDCKQGGRKMSTRNSPL